MWAALSDIYNKTLFPQEGTRVPSTGAVDECKSASDKILKEVSKSKLPEPAPCLGGMFWESDQENRRSPNLPLPHVTSPKGTPSQDDDRAPRIEAHAWRIRAAAPKALSVWEIRSLLFYEPGKTSSANSSLRVGNMHCSASASDEEWGQLPGWEMEHALKGVHTAGHGWGGRPDKNWEIWLGAEWDTSLQVERVKILQGEKRGRSFRSRNRGPTTAESVFIEAQFEDGSWGLVAGPVPLNADGWTTIRLCCAGAKRRRASPVQGSVRTPALRVASPNEAAPKLTDKECATPPLASTASASTLSVKKKKVSWARNNYSEQKAFASLGL